MSPKSPRWPAFSMALMLMGAVALSPAVQAGSLSFSLTQDSCSTGCTMLPAGTVTLTQIVSGSVDVSIVLDPTYSFRYANDSNHRSFAFNLDPTLVGVTITNVSNSPQTTQPFTISGPLTGANVFTSSGFGTFNWDLQCQAYNNSTGLGCKSGASTTPIQNLSFTISASNINLTSFQSNSMGAYFALDVVQRTGTGIGSTGNFSNSVTPEPATGLLLAGGVLGCLAFRVRRRRTPKASD